MEATVKDHDKRLRELEKQISTHTESMSIQIKYIGTSLDEFKTNFKGHDEKEMEKYEQIKRAIYEQNIALNKQNWKIAGLFIIATGAVNFDKLAPFISLISPF